MPSPEFRPATSADAARIAEIHVAAWRATYAGLIDEAALERRTIEKRMGQWMEVLEGRAWVDHSVHVVEVDGAVMGFSQFGPSDDDDADLQPTLHVYALYLDPAERGKGLGAALLDHVLGCGADAGYSLATLYVLEKNEGARGFYEKLGWQPEPDVVTECLGDGTEAPQLRYRKALSGRATAKS